MYIVSYLISPCRLHNRYVMIEYHDVSFHVHTCTTITHAFPGLSFMHPEKIILRHLHNRPLPNKHPAALSSTVNLQATSCDVSFKKTKVKHQIHPSSSFPFQGHRFFGSTKIWTLKFRHPRGPPGSCSSGTSRVVSLESLGCIGWKSGAANFRGGNWWGKWWAENLNGRHQWAQNKMMTFRESIMILEKKRFVRFKLILDYYCWWKKSCTSWYVLYQFDPTRFYTSQVVQDFFHQQ